MSEQDELSLLIDCLRTELAGHTPNFANAEPGTVSAAAAIAHRNKLLPLVGKRLTNAAVEVEALRQTASTLSGNALLLKGIEVISARLKLSGVQFCIIKGPLQQKVIYASFFCRSASDIDIIVSPRDFKRTREIIEGLDYETMTTSIWWRTFLGEEHLLPRTVPGPAVDLHHQVHQPGTPGPIEPERFLNEPLNIAVNGIMIPTLSVENLQLLCAISMAKALYNREPAGAYICDIFTSLMAGAPSAVNSFLTSARVQGLGGHAALALRLVRDVFDPDWLRNISIPASLPSVSSDVLVALAFTPEAAQRQAVKRRLLVWELCERDVGRFAREMGRILASEVTRRLFERGTRA